MIKVKGQFKGNPTTVTWSDGVLLAPDSFRRAFTELASQGDVNLGPVIVFDPAVDDETSSSFLIESLFDTIESTTSKLGDWKSDAMPPPDWEIVKHYGPGPHPGTGTSQDVHGGSRVAPFNRVLQGVENTMAAIGEEDASLPDRVRKQWEKIIGTSEDEITERYRGLLADAEGTKNWSDGLDWYWRQHNDLTELAAEYEQWDIEDMAGMAAALSPQAEWNANLRYTKEMAAFIDRGLVEKLSDEQIKLVNAKLKADGQDITISNGMALKDLTPRQATITLFEMSKNLSEDNNGWGSGAGYAPFEDAISIARGDPPTILRGVKTRSFYNMLWDPANTVDVTIDFQMMEAAAGRVISKRDNSKLNGTPSKSRVGEGKTSIGVRPYLADIVRGVASEYDITPSQAQAVIWLQWKEVK